MKEISQKYKSNISQIWKKHFTKLKEICQKYERNIAQIWKGLNQFFFPFTLGQSKISFHFFALLKGQWLEWATFVNCARVFAQRPQGNFAIFWHFKDFVLFASITIDILLLHTFIIHYSFSAHKVFGIISSFCLFGFLCQFPSFLQNICCGSQ